MPYNMMLNTVAIDEHTLLWCTGQVHLHGDWVIGMEEISVQAKDIEGVLQTTRATVVTYTSDHDERKKVTVVGSLAAVAALLGVKENV